MKQRTQTQTVSLLGMTAVLAGALWLCNGCSTTDTIGEKISAAGDATREAITGEPAPGPAKGGADSRNRE